MACKPSGPILFPLLSSQMCMHAFGCAKRESAIRCCELVLGMLNC